MDSDRQLKRHIKALQSRERAWGVVPVPMVSVAEAHELIERRFGRVSSVSGRALTPNEMALARADSTRPFDPATNAALLSQSELRRRSRLEADAERVPAHAAAAEEMRRRAQEASGATDGSSVAPQMAEPT